MAGFTDGIVRDQEDNEIFGFAAGDLVSFAGFEDESVAGGERASFGFVADETCAGEHVVKFPLGAMGMERADGFSGGHSGDFDVEGVALIEVGGTRLAAEGNGETLEGPTEFLVW